MYANLCGCMRMYGALALLLLPSLSAPFRLSPPRPSLSPSLPSLSPSLPSLSPPPFSHNVQAGRRNGCCGRRLSADTCRNTERRGSVCGRQRQRVILCVSGRPPGNVRTCSWNGNACPVVGIGARQGCTLLIEQKREKL